MHLDHTLFDAACDFVRFKTWVLQELCMRRHAEEAHTWEDVLRLMGDMGYAHMSYDKQCQPQLFLIRVTAPSAEQGHRHGCTVTPEQVRQAMRDRGFDVVYEEFVHATPK